MTRAYSTFWQDTDDGIQIFSDLSVSAPSVQRFMDVSALWTITKKGVVTVELNVRRNPEFPELPRFGLRLFLPKEMGQVSWYGMGPHECYRDKCRSTSHGLYHNVVSWMHEDYIRPQENGSRCDCDYVVVRGEHRSLTAVSAQPFSFNASPYTQEELTEKAHNYELAPCGSTVLCLDHAQNGIGSASCGPELLDWYKLNEQEFRFVITLVPANE